MKQSDIFSETEADAWWARNKDKVGIGEDPVIDVIQSCRLKPLSVIEIGCANGWRLEQLEQLYGCQIRGIEPSKEAAHDKWFIFNSTLQAITEPLQAEIVILGFCLYVVDRADLFQVVAKADSYVMDGGHLIIHDFMTTHPHSRKYKHDSRLRTYKYNYAELFLANPTYRRIHRSLYSGGNDQTVADVLRKDINAGFPLKPNGIMPS